MSDTQNDLPDWAKTGLPAWAQKPLSPEQQPKDLSWGQVGIEAVKNIPSSGIEFGKAIVTPFIHPSETIENFKNIGVGALQKFGIMSGHEQEKYADAVGQFFKDRYGSIEGLKHTIATDPVGFAADASLLLTGGGSLTARAPGVVGKIGEIAATAGRVVDPLTLPIKAAGGVARHVGGQYLAHIGGRPVSEAFEAGKEGGERGRLFRENMRLGENIFPETVATARSAVEAIGQEAGRVYRSGMVDIGKDYHILDFRDVYDALTKYEGVGKYKGVDLETPAVRDIRDRMRAIIDEWQGYAPTQYHTPEGFDALKRKLGYILDETERGSPAHLVASNIYNAVKGTIVKQAPTYAKIMDGYSEAKNIIRELERDLTGKADAPIGPALRKLQSVMRNNVHAMYGHREALAQLLVDNGADHLIARLAGQSLSSIVPRGLGRYVGSGALIFEIGEALWGHPEAWYAVAATLPMMSPRLMGEVAHKFGQAARVARPIRQGLFQAGRIEEAEEKKGFAPLQRTSEGYPFYQAFDAVGNLIAPPAEAMENPRERAMQFRPGELQGGGGGGGGLAEWQRMGKTTEMNSVEFARGLSNERQLLLQRKRQLENDRRRFKTEGEEYSPNAELQQIRTRLKELEAEGAAKGD